MGEFLVGETHQDLNAAQRKAVEHPGGPLLIKAGPGTGKTRTLTRRIAYLVREKGADPESVLAITFTNRAAREMKDRLRALLEEDTVSRMFIGTFHAFGLEIVQREAKELGFECPPMVYDEEDQKALLREVLEEIKPPSGRLPLEKVRSRLEAVMNREAPLAGEVDGYDLEVVHGMYGSRKRSEGAVDYDDLIHLPVRLFEENASRLASYRKRFRHLFVDEYQDVNAVQVRLVKLLGERAQSLTAIGDPDQAIYSFRCSDVRNFLRFERTFRSAEVLHLEDNYRSSVTILRASDQLISRNPEREVAPPAARASGGPGVLLELRALATARAEASFILHRIEQLTGGVGRYGLEDFHGPESLDEEEYGFGEIAVLYRLNTQALEIAKVFEKGGIPYQQVGTNRAGLSTHERAVLAAARLAVSPSHLSAWRVLNALGNRRGARRDPGMFRRLRISPEGENLLLEAGEALAGAVPEESGPLLDAARKLSETAGVKGLDPSEYVSAAPLLVREDPYEARSEKVTLSTLHAAKGLEFPVVFIAGCEEGLMPFIRENEADREAARSEERRLLYVGMTRAEQRIILTRSRQRILFGKRLAGEPSPFLADISENLVRFVREKGSKKKPRQKDDGQMSLF
jgi:superfamily I DNA/RNA helicase